MVGSQRRYPFERAMFACLDPGRTVLVNGLGKGVCLEMKMETQKATKNHHHIPIFPLGVVLLPDMTMPLHIFDDTRSRFGGAVGFHSVIPAHPERRLRQAGTHGFQGTGFLPSQE